MTYAQFKRMKPKYRRRLVLAMVIAFGLFVLLTFGVAMGVSAVRVQLNTTTLKGITAQTILEKDSMLEILNVLGQEQTNNLLVNSSSLTMDDQGMVTELHLEFVRLMEKTSYETWRLTATEKKATLRKVSTKYENMNALRLRKIEFGNYYPALSRITSGSLLAYFQENVPVGAGGHYTVAEEFNNNLVPQYERYLQDGLLGVWVSSIGAISEFQENFKPVATCVPTVVTATAVNEDKSKGKKIVLLEPEERCVVLLETGTY